MKYFLFVLLLGVVSARSKTPKVKRVDFERLYNRPQDVVDEADSYLRNAFNGASHRMNNYLEENRDFIGQDVDRFEQKFKEEASEFHGRVVEEAKSGWDMVRSQLGNIVDQMPRISYTEEQPINSHKDIQPLMEQWPLGGNDNYHVNMEGGSRCVSNFMEMREKICAKGMELVNGANGDAEMIPEFDDEVNPSPKESVGRWIDRLIPSQLGRRYTKRAVDVLFRNARPNVATIARDCCERECSVFEIVKSCM